jgi:hypothetical protein
MDIQSGVSKTDVPFAAIHTQTVIIPGAKFFGKAGKLGNLIK